MTKELTTKDKASEFLLYRSPQGEMRVEVFIHQENVWLTQKRMAELFDVTIPTINEHLKNIYQSKELDENSAIRKFRIVQKEGHRDIEREHIYYNLDTIISVGYRVNSSRATQFRIWATKILKEYLIKGFAMDDEPDSILLQNIYSCIHHPLYSFLKRNAGHIPFSGGWTL